MLSDRLETFAIELLSTSVRCDVIVLLSIYDVIQITQFQGIIGSACANS